MACFPHPSLVWRPILGNPLKFLDETYPASTRGMEPSYGENFLIYNVNRFWLIHPCDGRIERERERERERRADDSI